MTTIIYMERDEMELVLRSACLFGFLETYLSARSAKPYYVVFGKVHLGARPRVLHRYEGLDHFIYSGHYLDESCL